MTPLLAILQPMEWPVIAASFSCIMLSDMALNLFPGKVVCDNSISPSKSLPRPCHIIGDTNSCVYIKWGQVKTTPVTVRIKSKTKDVTNSQFVS